MLNYCKPLLFSHRIKAINNKNTLYMQIMIFVCACSKCVCVCVCMYVRVCACVCEQSPGNQSFGSAHKKGGGVRRVG